MGSCKLMEWNRLQRNGLLGLAAGIMAEVKIFAKLSTGGAVLLDEVLAQGSLAPPDKDKKTNQSN